MNVALLFTFYHLLFPCFAYYLFFNKESEDKHSPTVFFVSLFVCILLLWFYLIGLYAVTFMYPLLTVMGIIGILKLVALEFFFLDTQSVLAIKSSFRNYYVYLVSPAEISFSQKNPQHITRDRFLRGLVHLCSLLLLNVIFLHLPFLHDLPLLLRGGLSAFQMTLLFVAVSDLPLALFSFILPDVFLYDVFNYPFLSSSPREFWGKRWNLVTQKYIMKILYLPLGGRNNKTLAIIFVYVFVGAMHEIPMLFLPSARHGYWMAIFGLHICAMLGQFILESSKTWAANYQTTLISKVAMRILTLILLSVTADWAYKGFGTSLSQMAVDINNVVFLTT